VLTLKKNTITVQSHTITVFIVIIIIVCTVQSEIDLHSLSKSLPFLSRQFLVFSIQEFLAQNLNSFPALVCILAPEKPNPVPGKKQLADCFAVSREHFQSESHTGGDAFQRFSLICVLHHPVLPYTSFWVLSSGNIITIPVQQPHWPWYSTQCAAHKFLYTPFATHCHHQIQHHTTTHHHYLLLCFLFSAESAQVSFRNQK
jgi:hypothetical protein